MSASQIQKRIHIIDGFSIINLIIALLFFPVCAAEASWLIDSERFHMSAHGRTSCLDCHANIPEDKTHPRPEDVNKSLKDFFRLEQCTECHDDDLGDIGEIKNGRVVINGCKDFPCSDFHTDPHYLLSSDSDNIVDLSKPTAEKCGICHESQEKLPELSVEDELCMGCHRSISIDDPSAVEKISSLCFHCHEKTAKNNLSEAAVKHPVINVPEYRTTPHRRIPCLVCHPGSVEFRHSEQVLVECGKCHSPHDESIAHDAHFMVACEACHLKDGIPFKDFQSGRILWQKDRPSGDVSHIHNMDRSGKPESCEQCHFSGNPIGAVSMVLPAKSVLCMPCHAATFSAGDTITIVSLVVFLIGFFDLAYVWFSGSLTEEKTNRFNGKLINLLWAVCSIIFSSRIFAVMKAFVLEGFFQKRLFCQSKIRWGIHALIFYPFVFRFLWGLTALSASLWFPELAINKVLLDKNHPLGSFIFDVTGSMVILGVILAVIHKLRKKTSDPPGLPKQDYFAFVLLSGIIVTGFIVEGMRMTVTGILSGTSTAFLGYSIAILVKHIQNLDVIYGYVWYTHAFLWGAFVGYLPFSRMMHMILSPLVITINAIFIDDHKTIGPLQ